MMNVREWGEDVETVELGAEGLDEGLDEFYG